MTSELTHSRTNVEIRPMTMDDLEVVMTIVNNSFTSPWSRSWLTGALQNRDDCFFSVSKLQGVASQHIVGFAVYSFVIDQAHVMNIAVDPNYRGQQIGDALLEALIADAKARGSEQITLEVRTSNMSAIGLYRKHKFDVIGTRPNYYKDGEDAYIMMK